MSRRDDKQRLLDRLNLSRRDRMFTDRLIGECERLGCRTVELDVGVTEDEVTTRLIRLFGLVGG